MSKNAINFGMINTIIRSDAPVTLVGGGRAGAEDLRAALDLAPRLVAADSGAALALAAGHLPEAVIGDFDSITDADKARLPPYRLFHIAEQDSTDFEKALSRIAAPLVLAVGFLGARVDHQLAALNVLVRQAAPRCILIGEYEVIFHLPASVHLDLQPGDVVSLFPLAPVTGRSSGLEWPIDGLQLAPQGRVGTSNRALGPVSIDTDGPGLLALLPRARLHQAIDALTALPDAAVS